MFGYIKKREKEFAVLFLSFLLYAAGAFPPAFFSIFICLVPLLCLISRLHSSKEAFYWGAAFGLFYCTHTSFWLINTHWSLLLIALIYQSFWIGLFSCIAHRFAIPKSRSFLTSLAVPGLWVLMEFIKSSGFFSLSFGHIGYYLTPSAPLIQIASLGGIYLLSFFVVLINTMVFLAVKEDTFGKKSALLALALLFLSANFLWGQSQLKSAPNSNDTINVAVIQANISGKNKWDSQFLDNTISIHEKLSKGLPHTDVDLIVWPETSIPTFLFHEERAPILNRIQFFAVKMNKPLLVGTQDFKVEKDEKKVYNSAAYFSRQGILLGKYEKINLVPFTERSPFKSWVPYLRSMGLQSVYYPGKDYAVFELDGRRFSSVICFEALFPSLVRKFVKNGASVIINLTNDQPALKKMKYYYQFNADMAKVRAVENRRSFVRATNNGITNFIDPHGRVLKQGADIYEQAALVQNVPISNLDTLYTKFGNWIILFSIFILMIGLAVKKAG